MTDECIYPVIPVISSHEETDETYKLLDMLLVTIRRAGLYRSIFKFSYHFYKALVSLEF